MGYNIRGSDMLLNDGGGSGGGGSNTNTNSGGGIGDQYNVYTYAMSVMERYDNYSFPLISSNSTSSGSNSNSTAPNTQPTGQIDCALKQRCSKEPQVLIDEMRRKDKHSGGGSSGGMGGGYSNNDRNNQSHNQSHNTHNRSNTANSNTNTNTNRAKQNEDLYEQLQ